MSQYLKNPHFTTVTSKTRSTDLEPRSQKHPGCQCGNYGTDDRTADNSDLWAECDIPILRATSPQTLQMTNSPPTVAPQHPTTLPVSPITTHPPNLPTVYSDISNPATPKAIAASGSRDPPVPDANHHGETRNERGEGPAPNSPTRLIQLEAQLTGVGKLILGVTGKNSELFFSLHLHLNNIIIDSTHIS